MLKRFVYIEDVQPYYHYHVLMAQITLKPIAVKKLEKISYQNDTNRQFSATAEEFILTAFKHGVRLILLKRSNEPCSAQCGYKHSYTRATNIPDNWKDFPVIKSATGNY